MKASFQSHLARFRLKYPELTFTQALEQFALQFGISPRTGWRWKPDRPPCPPKPVSKRRHVRTDAERQRFHDLAARRLSARRIGRTLGWDHHTVRRWLSRAVDYRVKYPSRPRGPRGRFVALQYGQRLAPRIESRILPVLAPVDVPHERKALAARLQAALDGSQPLCAQEAMDIEQRVRRLQAQLGPSGPASESSRDIVSRRRHQPTERSTPPASTNDELTIRFPR